MFNFANFVTHPLKYKYKYNIDKTIKIGFRVLKTKIVDDCLPFHLDIKTVDKGDGETKKSQHKNIEIKSNKNLNILSFLM